MFHVTESGATQSPATQSAAETPAATWTPPQSENPPENQPETGHPISLPPHDQEILRMFLLGDYGAIRRMISRLAASGIADATRWTPLQPTGRDGEYIAVHTKRMAPES